MHKLLNKTNVDRQVTEMWDKISHISDEDNGRHEAVEQALLTQQLLYAQLALQDKALPALWNAIHIINPENPLVAALAINANAEKLVSILKPVNA